MPIELHIGPEIIRSYKRLNYTPWHALAEFVDNSTQSYLDNQEKLDEAYQSDNQSLAIDITYSRDNGGTITIRDNAMGMSAEELEHALRIGTPPQNTAGRSEFGMGMKTAACWLGNHWTVRTKKLGEMETQSIEFNVERVAQNNLDLNHVRVKESEDVHYTVISITELNKLFGGRTIGQIKLFLSSMFREDISNQRLILSWNSERLTWQSLREIGNLHVEDGQYCDDDFAFTIGEKEVTGWIAVLERGSRANAGFSVLRRGRVIKGWPDSWKPESIFGQYDGSNDLVNQRLVGEIRLDDFGVSHTKDGILWEGNEEEEVEFKLAEFAHKYVEIARSYRKREVKGDGPSMRMISRAIGMFEEELQSTQVRQLLLSNGITPVDILEQAAAPMIRAAKTDDPRISHTFELLTLSLFLSDQLSHNDPYLGIDVEADDSLNVVINISHPYFRDLQGSMGVLNHIRSCSFDGLARWRAQHNWNSNDPSVIQALKDGLLRVASRIDE